MSTSKDNMLELVYELEQDKNVLLEACKLALLFVESSEDDGSDNFNYVYKTLQQAINKAKAV